MWFIRPISVEDDGAPEFRSCVEVQLDVLGSPVEIVRTVSVDVKQH